MAYGIKVAKLFLHLLKRLGLTPMMQICSSSLFHAAAADATLMSWKTLAHENKGLTDLLNFLNLNI